MKTLSQKLLAGLLSMCVAFPSLPMLSASAAETEFTVKVPQSVQAGESFSLEIYVKDNQGFSSGGLTFELSDILIPDTDDKKQIIYEKGTDFPTLLIMPHYNTATQIMAVGIIGSDDSRADGMLTTLSMCVPDGTPAGTYQIPIGLDKITNVERESVNVKLAESFALNVTGASSNTSVSETTTTETTTEITTTEPTSDITTAKTTIETTTTEITTEPTSDITTAKTTTESVETTTNPPPALQLYGAAEDACPDSQTTLKLMLDGNLGISQLGMKITLPDVLKPQLDAKGNPIFTQTNALSNLVSMIYNADKNIIAINSVNPADGQAVPELGSLVLKVTDKAEIGKSYDIGIAVDKCASVSHAITYSSRPTVQFTAIEPTNKCVISKDAVTLKSLDETAALSLTSVPESAAVKWISDDENIAAVDENGVVHALCNGTTTVHAVCQGKQYDCKVTVSVPLRLNLYQLWGGPGKTASLFTMPRMTYGLQWRSTNPEIVTVDENGNAVLIADGEASIVAELAGQKYICPVYVKSYVLGDVDFNGTIDADDANLVLLSYLSTAVMGKPTPLDVFQELAADYNQDGYITADDSNAILMYYLEQIMSK